jgi:hypothetical protein
MKQQEDVQAIFSSSDDPEKEISLLAKELLEKGEAYDALKLLLME